MSKRFPGMPPRFRKTAVYMSVSKVVDEKRRPARRVRWDWRANRIVRQSQLEPELSNASLVEFSYGDSAKLAVCGVDVLAPSVAHGIGQRRFDRFSRTA